MRLLCLAILVLPAATLGNEPQFRAHPDCAARLGAVRTIGIAVPVMKVFELTAANNRVFQPEWSDRAIENVAGGLEAALRARGVAVKRLASHAAGPEEFREVTLLYEAVAEAILQATYANAFPSKLARFEYSLGDVQGLLRGLGVDAILFTYGVGNISSGGRKALQILSGAVSYGIDRIQVAVVDRTGAVLWFDAMASTDHDLRDRESAASFVAKLTRDLPAVHR